ncbi:MAG: PucR family transcriptional regulator ligand-binding domain-containing protein [Chitinispirillia bacterium]|nr:PucR family transcriptional regulator ligand-binding domain-containing protein [Chitinispirillia bacterium]
MKFSDIVQSIAATVVYKSSVFDSCNVQSVIVSDLMSDVLTMERPNPLIVSSLSSDQTLRTASMVDAAGVVIAQNKLIPPAMAKLAEELDLTLLHTPLAKFETCVLLGKLLEEDK